MKVRLLPLRSFPASPWETRGRKWCCLLATSLHAVLVSTLPVPAVTEASCTLCWSANSTLSSGFVRSDSFPRTCPGEFGSGSVGTLLWVRVHQLSAFYRSQTSWSSPENGIEVDGSDAMNKLTVLGKFWIDWHFRQKISLLSPVDALQLGQILATWQYAFGCDHRSILADNLKAAFLNILLFVLILKELQEESAENCGWAEIRISKWR